MKASTVIAIAASFAAASAQLSAIPQCALGCAISSIGSSGCQETDIACICSNQKFVQSLIPCVDSACPADQLAAVISAATKLCSDAGVSLTIPSGTAAPGGTSSAPATTTAAGTTTTTESSAASTTTSVVVVVPPPTNNTTTTAANPAPSSNGTVTTGSPTLPSATPTGNAAVRNTAAMGALGAVLAFAAALL